MTGKATGINWMFTCEYGICRTGTAWDAEAQQNHLNDFRMERETWYKRLVKNNAQIEVRAFRQETKVESLVLEDSVATGVQLTNGTIIRAGQMVGYLGIVSTTTFFTFSPQTNLAHPHPCPRV